MLCPSGYDSCSEQSSGCSYPLEEVLAVMHSSVLNGFNPSGQALKWVIRAFQALQVGLWIYPQTLQNRG